MQSVITFTVPGEPVGKGRPRFVKQTGSPYTPERTANFETLVKWEYHRQAGGARLQDEAEIGMRIEAYFSIPKSKSKRMQHDMEIGIVRHTKRPDADNLLKAVADALNNIAYHDDSAIVYAEVTKKYSKEPRTQVTLWEM